MTRPDSDAAVPLSQRLVETAQPTHGPEWVIRCSGGCGRTMRTNQLTVLFAVDRCPDCQLAEAVRDA